MSVWPSWAARWSGEKPFWKVKTTLNCRVNSKEKKQTKEELIFTQVWNITCRESIFHLNPKSEIIVCFLRLKEITKLWFTCIFFRFIFQNGFTKSQTHPCRVNQEEMLPCFLHLAWHHIRGVLLQCPFDFSWRQYAEECSHSAIINRNIHSIPKGVKELWWNYIYTILIFQNNFD